MCKKVWDKYEYDHYPNNLAMIKLNNLYTSSTPFIVITDWLGKKIEVYTLNEAKEVGIEFTIKHDYIKKKHSLSLQKIPVSFAVYKAKFDYVIEQIKGGNTYLLNLTQPTQVKCGVDLKTIYENANAPYKILYKNKFVCFSPETFITVEDENIATYPMKGTIDASLPNAEETILNDEKEKAEHVMVVDLLRNDLGIVAKTIRVERFRYIDRIDSRDMSLLQVSSKITGKLPKDYRQNFSKIFYALLPAGSISGTPKRKTIEIIKKIEGYDRGFFSGIFGYFDGKKFDSCVMIRFLEKAHKSYIYKSGGGITLQSDVQAEYKEMIDKVYIP